MMMMSIQPLLPAAHFRSFLYSLVGANVLRNESSQEQKFRWAKVPGSETSRE